MFDKIEKLKINALKEIKKARSESSLESIWRKYLGRKDGGLTKLLRNIKDLAERDRPKVGAFANKARVEIEQDITNRRQQLSIPPDQISKKNLGGQINHQSSIINQVDITLPGKKIKYGHLHLLTQVRYKVAEIFSSMGFEILEGRELETDYYNFETLNIPAGHPARDMWDTFWLRQNHKSETINNKQKGSNSKVYSSKLKGNLLLRTHTSAMQVRIMEKQKPPIRTCVIGKCFRNEATDVSHEHTLYQIEGFIVDKNITVANLIYTLNTFLNILFGQKVKVRLRPSYFPFTEPSFEMDFACLNCHGSALYERQGCSVCGQSGWVELLGCGMIHPHVFKSAGYPRGKYTGFAFGAGLDRIIMMKHKINDIRWLHSGDLRFLRQF